MLARFKIFVKKNYTGWLFAMPLVIGLLVFTAIPVIQSLIYSFFDYDGVWTMDFIGFDNFTRIFTTDREFYKVLSNTAIYTFASIPITLVLSYMLAVLVNQKMKNIVMYRVMYYLPCMIPAVVSGLLWKDIFDPTFGIFNRILSVLGLPQSQFFNSAASALPSVLLMNIWGIGGGMILWLSAFKSIPEQLYEAAKIDGAGPVKRLVAITLPMSTPMIFFNVVTMIIGSLQYNGTLTFASNMGKGVDNSLYFYAVKIYIDAFKRYQLGYASALAWVLLVLIAGLTFITFKTNKWVYYGEES